MEDVESIAWTLRLADGAGFLARVLNTRSTVLYQQLTGQEEVTPRQFGALLVLHQRGPLTLTELAERISVDRSTLSEMARRLVDNGLISRTGNARDRRSATVSLSPKGREVLLRLLPGAARLQDALLAPLPPSERRQFLRALRLISGLGTEAG
ncbi:MarR family winged helix-turn-helix transcriptional regulator [Roseomonas chloroacetimidivorans]|uniref:MarR family winged helix-turn-helix transcriptional regulator n=1 Tax=Roseomonas chloroacetimidivorans TaxID=1766656 RepID=UPI003C726695